MRHGPNESSTCERASANVVVTRRARRRPIKHHRSDLDSRITYIRTYIYTYIALLIICTRPLNIDMCYHVLTHPHSVSIALHVSIRHICSPIHRNFIVIRYLYRLVNVWTDRHVSRLKYYRLTCLKVLVIWRSNTCPISNF